MSIVPARGPRRGPGLCRDSEGGGFDRTLELNSWRDCATPTRREGLGPTSYASNLTACYHDTEGVPRPHVLRQQPHGVLPRHGGSVCLRGFEGTYAGL